MNRREFLTAAAGTVLTLAIPLYDANGVALTEILIVIVVLLVVGFMVVKLYKFAKAKLYPPPPPPPQEPPPDHQQATLDAAESGLIYGIAYLDYHMPDRSLCTHYAETFIQSAADLAGPWVSELIRIWISGTTTLVSWRNEIITGTIDKQPAQITANATITAETSTSPRRFYRTMKP